MGAGPAADAPSAVAWERTHGGRLLHALPLPADADLPPRSGPALCGARVEVDLRHRSEEGEDERPRCRRCRNLLAQAAGRLPEAEPGMLF